MVIVLLDMVYSRVITSLMQVILEHIVPVSLLPTILYLQLSVRVVANETKVLNFQYDCPTDRRCPSAH